MPPNPLRTRYPVDLHTHTTRSDGHDTPIELIENASRLGMYALAITDHDIYPPIHIVNRDGQEQDIQEFASSLGVILVPGYEFSTDTWVDEVHICGYHLDWSRSELQEEVAAARSSKLGAYKELCARLTALGMPLDWDADILHATSPSGQPINRTADDVERKHVFEAMATKGYAPSWSAAKLIVRDNPYLNVRRRKIDPVDAIRLIHECGGVAVLAHPHLIDETVCPSGQGPMSRFEYIDQLIQAGLDGIEFRYTYDKTTYKGQLTPEEIETETYTRYADRVAFLSGGSDYHAGHKGSEKKVRSLGERGLSIEEFESIRAQGWAHHP